MKVFKKKIKRAKKKTTEGDGMFIYVKFKRGRCWYQI